MIDHIKTRVDWDGDEEIPFYDIDLKIYVNDPDMTTTLSMFHNGMDPNYLVDEYMVKLLKIFGISSREINQIYITVIGNDGKVIYGN